MSDSEASHSNVDRSNHNQEISNKLFITNLDGKANEQQLKDALRSLFEKYGTIDNLVVKKSRNSQYSFAFIQYKSGQDASAAVNNLNRQEVMGKQIKVELQDNSKRRKDSQYLVSKNSTGCYICGKKGHFARECRSKNQHYRRRSVSSSQPRKKHKKHRKYQSDSSDRERSRTPKKKKQKKHRSRDRDEKKKKKDKKRRRDSSED